MTMQIDACEVTRHATLFEDLAEAGEAQVERAQVASERGQGAPRVLQPNRLLIELRASDLESLLGEDHRARLVWGYVDRQDLSAPIDTIKGARAPGDRHANSLRAVAIRRAQWRGQRARGRPASSVTSTTTKKSSRPA
jgi:hypothetical protein